MKKTQVLVSIKRGEGKGGWKPLAPALSPLLRRGARVTRPEPLPLVSNRTSTAPFR